MSSIGSLNCDTINWPKGVPYTHSSAYRQPGRDGNGHILGPQYSDSTVLRSTHFIASKSAEQALLDSAAAICGGTATVSEDVAGGSPVTIADVFVESVKVAKGTACASSLGNYMVILEFMVYLPLGS